MGVLRAMLLAGCLGLGGGPAATSAAWAQSNAASGLVSMDGLANHQVQLANFNFANLSMVSTELGFTISVIMAPSSYPMLAITDKRGVKIILQPINCSGLDLFKDTCSGMLMSSVVAGLPGISLQRLNAFNNAQFFSRGHLVAGNRAVLSRLLVADYGIAKGNLGLEIYSFRSALYNYGRFLNTVQVSELDGGPMPGAQGLLGRLEGLKGMGSLQNPGNMESLGLDLEEGPVTAPELLEAMHLLDEYTTRAENILSKD
jgi:hypothetical protein